MAVKSMDGFLSIEITFLLLPPPPSLQEEKTEAFIIYSKKPIVTFEHFHQTEINFNLIRSRMEKILFVERYFPNVMRMN